MTTTSSTTFTGFDGERIFAKGSLAEVARALVTLGLPQGQALVFGDQSGQVVDIDTRGGLAATLARLSPAPEPDVRGRGRPKLGVISREVTLLPRHWDWLAAQPGGASVAIRKLVDAARGEDQGKTQARAARDAAYRFMSAMAGNRPNFEDAIRALYAGDAARLSSLIMSWPRDIRDHARALAFG